MSATSGTELVRYDAMCRAIVEAHAVDEVKDIRDKALAIEVYARQAKNIEAEAKACEIRLRAERRAGELLRVMEKVKSSPGNQHTGPVTSSDRSNSAPTLADLGISKPQSSRWQKLADIPQEDFEATFSGQTKPTTSGLLRRHAETVQAEQQEEAQQPARPPVHPNALWLWGRLLDFERNGLLDADPETLFANMLPHMQEATRELAPRVILWLERLPQ